MLRTVSVPEDFEQLFQKAESYVGDYFKDIAFRPEDGTIEASGERYLLIRTSSLSVDFLNFIKSMYPGIEDETALDASSKVLFDMAKSFGMSDAKKFSEIQGVTEPIEKLSSGPVHFAYTGWANVCLDPGSHLTPDENFYLSYHHPHSFEADAWIRTGKKTDFCTCVMNAGYSSGWSQESFGIELIAKELTCRARGDRQCRFVMSQPHRLDEFVTKFRKEHPELF